MPTINRRILLQGSLAALGSTSLVTTSAAGSLATPSITDQSLHDEIEQVLREAGVPGGVLLKQRPGMEPELLEIGYADLERTTPVSADMHVRIGSITKTFTSTIVLQLVAEGLLSLEDSLSDRLPDAGHLPHADHITIEQMLTMTSGLAEYLNHPEPWRLEALNATKPVPIEQVIGWVEEQEPMFEPGTAAIYCNTNYRLLPSIAEHIADQSFPDLVAERVVKPLGLTSTYVPIEPTLPDPSPNAYSYFRNMMAKMAAAGEPMPLENIPDDFGTPVVDDPPMEVSRLEQHPSSGDGNIVSTIHEMNTFIRAVVDGDLLPPELSALQRDCRHEFPPLMYGMGVTEILDTVGHGGNVQGFGTWACVDLEDQTSYVLWTNADPTLSDIPPNLILLTLLTGRPLPDLFSE